jgi:iduronate 2-sulfatase
MKMKFSVATTTLVVVALAALSGQSAAQTEPATSPVKEENRPNILFIAVDDLKPILGCYGDELAITPNLDRLAEKGLLFEKAYCQVAVCNPSRASLMTGQRPDKLGVWTLPIHFREAKPLAVTMPQWFRQHGYTAVGHGKIYHNPTPDPQSWSEPVRRPSGLPYQYPEGTREVVRAAMEKLPANDRRKNNLRGPCTSAPDLPDDQLLDGAQTNMAIKDLRRLGKQDKPFFLAMGYIRPHLAFVAPKKYWDLYDPASMPVLANEKPNPDTPQYSLHNNSEFSHYVDLIDMPKPWDDEPLSDEMARKMLHGYHACVSYVDAQIGRLLDALEEEGLAGNTIVVLWSDHGYKLGNYRGCGKMTNYEIDTRVPMMISAPGMITGEMPTAGAKTGEVAELLDLFPTLCELTGIDAPDFLDGESLVPLLKDPTASVHEGAISQYHRRNSGDEVMGYAIRTKTHRLVEWRSFSTGEVVAEELYDHRSDPKEKQNIAADDSSSELIDELTDSLLKTHPRRKLEMLPTIHSSPSSGRLDADISFENQSETEIAIIPISTKGARVRKRIKKVQPGDKVTLKSHIGSVFVVESLDGKIYEIHSPSLPTRTLVIESPQQKARVN